MTIFEQFKTYFKNDFGHVFTCAEIKKALNIQYGTNPSSIIPSDYCYNRINDGINFKKHIFEYLSENRYRFLNEDYPYSGIIIHKPKKGKEAVVGSWNNGIKTLDSRKLLYAKTDISIRDKGNNNPNKLFQNSIHLREEILSLISRADDDVETRNLIIKFSEHKRCRKPFYLDMEDFEKILHWKLRGQYYRQFEFRKKNSESLVKAITEEAFRIINTDEDIETKERLLMLTQLHGVAIPIASAILTLCHPDRYAVIDFRGWWQIFGEKKSAYSTRDYLRYLHIIKDLSIKYKCTTQQIDMAIWQYDKEMYPKKIRICTGVI